MQSPNHVLRSEDYAILSYIIKNIKSSTFFNGQNNLIKLNQEKIVQVLIVVPLDPMQTL